MAHQAPPHLAFCTSYHKDSKKHNIYEHHPSNSKHVK